MNMNECVYCMEQLAPGSDSCPRCGRRQDYRAPQHHLRPGSMLQGRYRIGRALGEGGFGITYIGRDTMLEMRVAVKEFFPTGYSHRSHSVSNRVTMTNGNNGADYEKDMHRFLAEARTLARFSDEPGIVGVRDFFQENGTAYIVMEFLDGVTLKEYLRRQGTIAPQKLFVMLDPVMVTLHRIHQENLVHRDISPDNIMILHSGKVKLLDFGAARETTGDKSLSVVLKHGYAPMEQYQTRGSQGAWTDVYALCATMYRCITGTTPLEALERVYQDDLKRPSELGVDIPIDQEAALMKGLSVRYQNRFQTMEALRQALRPQPQPHRVTIQEQDTLGETRKPRRTAAEDDYTVIGAGRSGTSRREPDPPPVVKKKKPSSKTPILLAAALCAVVAVAVVFSGGNESDTGSKPAATAPSNKTAASGAVVSSGSQTAVLPASCLSDEEVAKLWERMDYSQGYELQYEGTISDPNWDLSMYRGGVTREEDGGMYLLTYLGQSGSQQLLDDDFSAIDYLGNGLYAARAMTGKFNSIGLIDRNGETILGHEAALIQWMDRPVYTNKPGRYLMVGYILEETTDKDKVFLGYTGYDLTLGISYIEYETGYTGYARVFDTQTMAFVPNVEIRENVEQLATVCGENFAIRDAQGVSVYNSMGEEVLRLSAEGKVGAGILVDVVNEIYQVTDENGNVLCTSPNYLGVIDGENGYISTWDGEKEVIMDATGKVVLEVGASYVFVEHNHIFTTYDEETETQGLVRRDGTVILEEGNYSWTSYIDHGFYYASNDGEYDEHINTLVDGQGIVATELPYPGTLNLVKNQKAYVFKDGAFQVNTYADYASEMAYAMITAPQSEDGKVGVIDLFTGELLLPYEYDSIYEAGEYLYAYRNGAWEVYSYSLPHI